MIASFILDTKILPFLIFFFGVWAASKPGAIRKPGWGKNMTKNILIIGAGMAGLTAAYLFEVHFLKEQP